MTEALPVSLTGVADSSVTLRRAQFRAADVPERCAAISRQIIAGKLQNSRNSLLRAARESTSAQEQGRLESVADALARQIRELPEIANLDSLRGAEGMAANVYFSVLSLTLKQQREDFAFFIRKDYGTRVQKSVFECQVGRTEWVLLRDRLLKAIKPGEDSLRFYFLDDIAKARIEHHGV